MEKFNHALVRKIKEEEEYQKEQEALKKKHHIADKRVIVVEKANMVKFLIKTLSAVLKTGALAAIVCLSFAGLAALVYPEPRREIISIFTGALKELAAYLQ